MASPFCPWGKCWRREEERGGGVEYSRKKEEELGVKEERRGEGSMLRDPSQEQVTLRTCVAWQAGYRREGGE